MQYLIGTKVLSVNRRGSSCPVVVADESGATYLVKLRRSGSNPYSGISDYLCSSMALFLGMPVSKPHWIHIGDAIDLSAVDEEVRDIVRKSEGYNLAFPFHENGKDLRATAIDNSLFFHDLLVFDLFVLNIDRHGNNTNILQIGSERISFDFEASMLILGILQEKDFHRHPDVLKQLKGSPLYRGELSAEPIAALQERLKRIDLLAIFEGMPEPWKQEMFGLRDKLLQGLHQAIHRTDLYPEMLRHLHEAVIETAAEKQKRILENRKKFEAKL